MPKKILLIDDDQNYRLQIAGLIQSMSYAALEAASGEQALDVALAEEPDLIVTSVELPSMNGIELTMRLKQNSKTSYILVIAYSSDPNHGSAALKAGAALFLAKAPSFFDELKNAIANALKARP
jgi:CheY-like chemotaxis protein